MNAWIEQLNAHAEIVVGTVVTLGLLWLRTAVQARVASYGVREVEPQQVPGSLKRELVKTKLRRLPIGIRPISDRGATDVVEAAHKRFRGGQQ